MSIDLSMIPPGSADLLRPPPDLMDLWERHGGRARQAIALSAAENTTEAEFCADVSLRLWYTVNSFPFRHSPAECGVGPHYVELARVAKFLWTAADSTKARAFALDPNLSWPPIVPIGRDWPWERP